MMLTSFQANCTGWVAADGVVWQAGRTHALCALGQLWQPYQQKQQLGTRSASKGKVGCKRCSQSKNSSWLQTLPACHHSPCGPPQAPLAGQPVCCWGHQSGARRRRRGRQSPPLHGTGLASHIGPTSRAAAGSDTTPKQNGFLKPRLPAHTGRAGTP